MAFPRTSTTATWVGEWWIRRSASEGRRSKLLVMSLSHCNLGGWWQVAVVVSSGSDEVVASGSDTDEVLRQTPDVSPSKKVAPLTTNPIIFT